MEIVAFKNFSKRRNSTKRPDMSTGDRINVRLKEDTSVESPSFVISEPMPEYTYIYALNHFYFVDDVVNLSNFQAEIRCSQDVLATYKSDILMSEQKVIYSSSDGNTDIIDHRLQPWITYKDARSKIDYQMFNTTGCYIFGCMNGYSNGAGGIATYYAMNASQLQQLSNTILNDDSFFTNLAKYFTNPMDAILSCIWLPIDINKIPGTNQYIFIGHQPTNIEGKKISDRKIYLNSSSTNRLAIPYPSNAVGYKKKSPYSTGLIFLPFVGVVPADLDVLSQYNGVDVDVVLDVLTGDLVYSFSNVSIPLAIYNANCATNIPLSASGYNAMGALSGVITTIGGVAAGIATGGVGGAAAIAGGVAGGALGIAKSMEFHTQVNGSISSAVGISAGDFIEMQIFTYDSNNIEAFKSVEGLPCNQWLSLAFLSGYCQCENASIELNARSGDRDAVNSFLNNGFYIE